MNDRQIRTALRRVIFRRHLKKPDTVLLEEIGIRHGAARIDLAVVNNALHGYEVKSDRDSLYRLENQIRLFNSVFDKMTLVVGYKHAGAALDMVPVWWGVKLAQLGPRGAIHFSDARSPRKNPNVDKYAVVKLLWKSEALEILTTLGIALGLKSRPRKEIYRTLAANSDLEFIRAKTREVLKVRKAGKSAERLVLYGDSSSQPANLKRSHSSQSEGSSP